MTETDVERKRRAECDDVHLRLPQLALERDDEARHVGRSLVEVDPLHVVVVDDPLIGQRAGVISTRPRGL
jgi:hypothetical protein